MRVEEELKHKRDELLVEVEALTLRIETIRRQVGALDQVIAIYDPAHVPEATTTTPLRQKRARQVIALPPELRGFNKSHAILETLRAAGRPLSSAECARQIARARGVADEAAPPRFVSHVSASLSALMRRNRVRQVGTIDGQKHLWEIAD